jgi:thioredoxin 1
MSVTEKNDYLLENGVTLLDFYAEWCGPCKMLTPVIDDLSTEFSDNKEVKITKINVDLESDLANKYGIRGIPALLFFKNGELIDRLSGLQPKDKIKSIIDGLKN